MFAKIDFHPRIFLQQHKIKMEKQEASENRLLDWIEQNKLNWKTLSKNPHAIPLLEANPDKINWNWLSQNPNAISLLEANPDKIDWNVLSQPR